MAGKGNGKLKVSKELDDVDLNILSHVMQRPTITDAEIGQIIGTSRESVNRRRKNPRFKEASHQLSLEAIEVFRQAMNKAARKIVSHIDSAIPSISLDAAKTVIKFAELAEENHQGDTLTIKLHTDWDRAMAVIEVKRKSADKFIDI